MQAIERSIVVEAPVAQVYHEWTRIEEFPRFMKSLQVVTPLGEDRYRVIAERAGIEYESVFRVMLNIPEKRIAWRTESGAESSGVVCFEESGEGKTTVHFTMKYSPDAGWQQPEALAARLEANLENFKSLILRAPEYGH